MKKNDTFGKYVISVDREKHLIQTKCIGNWSLEDYERYMLDVKSISEQLFKNKEWVTLQDLKEYKPSTNVTPQIINDSIEQLKKLGYKYSAIIVDSATLKVQLNRSIKHLNGFEMFFCSNEKEALDWLNSKGH